MMRECDKLCADGKTLLNSLVNVCNALFHRQVEISKRKSLQLLSWLPASVQNKPLSVILGFNRNDFSDEFVYLVRSFLLRVGFDQWWKYCYWVNFAFSHELNMHLFVYIHSLQWAAIGALCEKIREAERVSDDWRVAYVGMDERWSRK